MSVHLDLDALDANGDYVESLEGGWDFLYDAIELWSLVDVGRSAAIAELKKSAKDRFRGRQIDELRSLLAGLEEALRATIIDADWRIPAERVEELTRRAPHIDWSPGRSIEDRRHAVGEALHRVKVLDGFLARARANGHDVARAD